MWMFLLNINMKIIEVENMIEYTYSCIISRLKKVYFFSLFFKYDKKLILIHFYIMYSYI